MIVLYDIPSQLPINAWSPSTWKTRYCLNYKGIPYKTEWIEYPDIEALCKKLGILPTQTKADGSPYYTLPAIHDPSTGTFVADSWTIAEYLDETYPETPKLFPPGTKVLQQGFISAYGTSLDALWEFLFPVVATKLNPRSEAYFTLTRSKMFGKNLQDVVPKGDEGKEKWKKLESDLMRVDKWMQKGTGPFIMGNTITFADFMVAGYTLYMKTIWGEDSTQWKDVKSWHGGRWEKILENLKEYEVVL